MTLSDALLQPSVQGAEVGKVLTWQHRWGWHRARMLCLGLGISETRRVLQLTERQRALIAERVA